MKHLFHSQPNTKSAQKRVRATVIVERDGAVLLTRTQRGLIMLPGGGVNRDELPIAAAARELHEETGLSATSITLLFQHESHAHSHWVFHALATGTPIAGDDAESLIFLQGPVRRSELNMTPATRDIIGLFESMKRSEPAHTI